MFKVWVRRFKINGNQGNVIMKLEAWTCVCRCVWEAQPSPHHDYSCPWCGPSSPLPVALRRRRLCPSLHAAPRGCATPRWSPTWRHTTPPLAPDGTPTGSAPVWMCTGPVQSRQSTARSEAAGSMAEPQTAWLKAPFVWHHQGHTWSMTGPDLQEAVIHFQVQLYSSVKRAKLKVFDTTPLTADIKPNLQDKTMKLRDLSEEVTGRCSSCQQQVFALVWRAGVLPGIYELLMRI